MYAGILLVLINTNNKQHLARKLQDKNSLRASSKYKVTKRKKKSKYHHPYQFLRRIQAKTTRIHSTNRDDKITSIRYQILVGLLKIIETEYMLKVHHEIGQSG